MNWEKEFKKKKQAQTKYWNKKESQKYPSIRKTRSQKIGKIQAKTWLIKRKWYISRN